MENKLANFVLDSVFYCCTQSVYPMPNVTMNPAMTTLYNYTSMVMTGPVFG